MGLKDIASGSIFEQQTLHERMIKDYYDTNQLKLDAEKKLKAWKPTIMQALKAMGKNAVMVGLFKVVLQIKNTGKVNQDKLVALLEKKAKKNKEFKKALKFTVNEEGLQTLIEAGLITMEEIHGECYEANEQEALVVTMKKETDNG